MKKRYKLCKCQDVSLELHNIIIMYFINILELELFPLFEQQFYVTPSCGHDYKLSLLSH